MLKQFNPLSRDDLLLTVKLLIIVLCAYEAAVALSLASPIWAGITAAIIAGGTPGAARHRCRFRA